MSIILVYDIYLENIKVKKERGKTIVIIEEIPRKYHYNFKPDPCHIRDDKRSLFPNTLSFDVLEKYTCVCLRIMHFPNNLI